MLCDECGQEVYIFYFNGEHHHVCDCCYIHGEADDLMDYEQIERGDQYGQMGFV